ncbi:hypothetical protein KCU73_g436, partial [Aureobasidium melanogenum]
MDRLSAELKSKRKCGGTKAVIDHLDKFFETNGDVERSKIEAVVVRFIISEQDELEYCAVQIEECLRKNKIPVDDVNKILAQARRRKAALKTIEQCWSYEQVEHYAWHEKGIHFLEDLANIAGRENLPDAVELFNRVISDSKDHGDWGREDHRPERPIKQVHLTKVLRHLIELEKRKKNKVRAASNPLGKLSIVPLGKEELNSKGLGVDVNGLIIARSPYSVAQSNRNDSPNHANITDLEEAMLPDCTSEDFSSDIDGSLENSFHPATATSSGFSPRSRSTEGGVDLTNLEGQPGDEIVMKRAVTESPNPQATDHQRSTRKEEALEDLLCEKFELLYQRLLENSLKTLESQEDLTAKIIDAIRNLDLEARPNAEAAQSAQFVDYNTELIQTLEKKLAEKSCRCENILTPQKQEGIISGLYEDLSRQLLQLKEGLDFTRSSINQGLSQQPVWLDKDLTGEIRAHAQNDLDILYRATNDHLEQLHRACRDCIAHAGITMADELKTISSVGLAITNNLSVTLKKHVEETAQNQRREFEKLIIQMKHDFDENRCGPHDQQTVVLTAIESQTKAIVSTISTIQDSVIITNGEMQSLRKDLQALRSAFVDSRATDTSNNTLDHKTDFGNKEKRLEVAKRCQQRRNMAGAPENTQVGLYTSNATREADIQGWSGSLITFVGTETGPDSKALFIVSEKDTDHLGYGIHGPEPSGQRLALDDDVASIINEPVSLAAPSLESIFTHDARSTRRAKSEYRSASIRSLRSPQKSCPSGGRRTCTANSRLRSSLAKTRICSTRSKFGGHGGNITPRSGKDAARIKKLLDKARKARKARLSARKQRILGTESTFIQSSADSDYQEQSEGPECTQYLVQHSDHISGDNRTSNTEAKCKDGDSDFDRSEASGDFASTAVTPTRESQDDSYIYTLDSAANLAERLLTKPSKVTDIMVLQVPPPLSTCTALGEEEDSRRQPVSSLESEKALLGSPSSSSNHITSERERAMIVPAKNGEANVMENFDVIQTTYTQPHGSMQDSENVHREDDQLSCRVGCKSAVGGKTLADSDDIMQQDQLDSPAGQKVRREDGAVEERLLACVRDHGLRQHPDAIADEVSGEEPHRRLELLETNGMDSNQSENEKGRSDHNDSEKTQDFDTYHLQGNEHNGTAGVTNPDTGQCFDSVAHQANRSWHNNHTTNDLMENRGYGLEAVRMTTPPQTKSHGQGVTEKGCSSSLDVEHMSGELVPTPPHRLLISDKDSAPVHVNPSGTVDERNLSQHQSPVSCIDSGVPPSGDCAGEESGATDQPLKTSTSDQSASWRPEEGRGQKRPRKMSHEGYKNKHPKFEEGINAEVMAGSTTEKRESESFMAFSGPFSFTAEDGVSTSFQNEPTRENITLFSTAQLGTVSMESDDRRNRAKDVEKQDGFMQSMISPDEDLLEEDKSIESASKCTDDRKGITIPLAPTSILNNSPISTIEDMVDQGITRGEELSSIQPASSPLKEVHGRKRPRETPADEQDHTNKRHRPTSTLKEMSYRDGARRDMTASGNGRCERITGSSDIEMTNSSTLLDQDHDPQSGHGPESKGNTDESIKLGRMTLVSANGGWKALVEKNKRERERTKLRTRHARDILQQMRRERETGIAVVFPKDFTSLPPCGNPPSIRDGETPEATHDQDRQRQPESSSKRIIVCESDFRVAIQGNSPVEQHDMTRQAQSGVDSDNSATTTVPMDSQMDGTQPTKDHHDEGRCDDPISKDVLNAKQTLKFGSILEQTSYGSAAHIINSVGYQEIAQQEGDSGTSEIVDYAAVIDNFSQTVPELER